MADHPNSGRRWMAHPPLMRINQDILEFRGCRIWLSMAIGGSDHSTPIVRRIYAQRGHRPQSGQGTSRVVDEVVFGASRANIVLGTIAVRIDSPAGLRADVRYDDRVNALRSAGFRLCEFDRLALEQTQDVMDVLGALFRLASLYAGEVRGATDILLEVHPRQVETHRRLLGFQRTGGDYPRVLLGVPRVLLRLQIARLEERSDAIVSRANAAQGRLYDVALDSRDEQEASRRMQNAIANASAAGLSAPQSGSIDRIDAAAAYVEPLPTLTRARGTAQFETRNYDEGLRAGLQARVRKESISVYLRVGLDEFARGFRVGYFASAARLRANDCAGDRATV